MANSEHGEPLVTQHNVVHATARARAYDQFAAALLAPADRRQDLITLAAFLGEVATATLTAPDAVLGEIRLQWWRDAIAGFERGERTGSPIADGLQDVARRRRLPTALLEAVVEGRSRELYEDGIADETAFTRYLEESEGAAFRLAAVVLGGEASAELDDAASAAAGAYGRACLALKLLPFVARQRLPVPDAWFLGADPRGATPDDARRSLNRLVTRLGSEARVELARFRDKQASVPKTIFAAFLPIVLVEPYLRLLSRGDVLLELADVSRVSKLSRLWLAKWRGNV